MESADRHEAPLKPPLPSHKNRIVAHHTRRRVDLFCCGDPDLSPGFLAPVIPLGKRNCCACGSECNFIGPFGFFGEQKSPKFSFLLYIHTKDAQFHFLMYFFSYAKLSTNHQLSSDDAWGNLMVVSYKLSTNREREIERERERDRQS